MHRPGAGAKIHFAQAGPPAIVPVMRWLTCFVLTVCGTGALLRAESTPPPASWTRIAVAPMKTSIYVGSVTLTTGELQRHGASLTTTYSARVFPWFFWGESGRFAITLTEAELAGLARGATVQFTGRAVNQKNKPRQVTGRAQPVDATTGKLKVRIMADGLELIFNGTYRLEGK
jgi:hypothetical protein